jgi:hypothetical protein
MAEERKSEWRLALLLAAFAFTNAMSFLLGRAYQAELYRGKHPPIRIELIPAPDAGPEELPPPAADPPRQAPRNRGPPRRAHSLVSIAHDPSAAGRTDSAGRPHILLTLKGTR